MDFGGSLYIKGAIWERLLERIPGTRFLKKEVKPYWNLVLEATRRGAPFKVIPGLKGLVKVALGRGLGLLPFGLKELGLGRSSWGLWGFGGLGIWISRLDLGGGGIFLPVEIPNLEGQFGKEGYN